MGRRGCMSIRRVAAPAIRRGDSVSQTYKCQDAALMQSPPLFVRPAGPVELVSVIITTMDRFDSCVRCLESVVAQDHSKLDVIVVEDGSLSGIEDYIARSGFNNVRYLRLGVRGGLSAARNAGIRIANGRFIAFVDDDDAWKPSRLSRQVSKWTNLNDLEVSRTAMIYCGAEIRSRNDNSIGTITPVNHGSLRESAIKCGLRTIPSSYLFQRSALEFVGYFDERLVSSVDHDIWMA
ncbi:MAG: glycosyltransferase family 2 protein, partial [Cytophagaceae bacterium]